MRLLVQHAGKVLTWSCASCGTRLSIHSTCASMCAAAPNPSEPDRPRPVIRRPASAIACGARLGRCYVYGDCNAPIQAVGRQPEVRQDGRRQVDGRG